MATTHERLTDPRTHLPPADAWPALAFDECRATLQTLHLWTQVLGKVRLARMPWINHSWHVPLYVTARGLGTSPVPAGGRVFELDLDLGRNVLDVVVSDGGAASLELPTESVADFHRAVMERLTALGVPTEIHTTPSEIPDGIPFDRDTEARICDPDVIRRFWQALVSSFLVFQRFRARFRGKASPVHFFWGSFDLATSRFSGRPAPEHPGGIPALPDWVAREAYDREVSSLGFWPGDDRLPEPAFYSYVYPAPDGFAEADPGPEAYFHEALGEFVLPYEAVRRAPEPGGLLLGFAQRTYEAAADLGGWDRELLEWPGGGDGPARD